MREHLARVMREPMTEMGSLRTALKGGKRLRLDQLQPIIERRLHRIYGRFRLYRLLGVLQAERLINSEGRGRERVYWLQGEA